MMKLKFEANQEYQLEAIQAMVDVFRGQVRESEDFAVEVRLSHQLQIEKELLVANVLGISADEILENVQDIQKRFNVLHAKEHAETGERFGEIRVSEQLESMDFSVEMETGTGKTYVYLRTIFELHKQYGFKKFVIVVPSIAIKEGVLKNLEITKEHFAMLYNHPGVDFYLWDSKKRGLARQFAMTNAIQIMVITIDSFARDATVIRQQSDWGVPIEYIQQVRPVVIVDEPQNMETDKRRKAISDLMPLCTLRYSATHKNPYHLLYRLDPVRAYDLGLVKRIEVDSVFSDDSFNEAYVKLLRVESKRTKILAKVEIDKSDAYGLQRKELQLQVGDDLYELSGQREVYRDGYVVDEINTSERYITFINGRQYFVGQQSEVLLDEVMKHQIRRTIYNHFEKERKLKGKGIKVLSLFFIDKVANYRVHGEASVTKGKFALWFEELFKEFQQKAIYQGLIEYDADMVHDGYFSQDKKTGAWKDSRDRGGEGGSTKDDEDTYELIMKDKERLLDMNTPLRFIFSHSALREGWDNPNVFQICTLNETISEIKKRQEIGRGLRLPVNKEGERIFDVNLNILTVVANESYEQFAQSLQAEIEDECGVSFAGRIKNAKQRARIRLKKEFKLDPYFQELWERIKQKTKYNVSYTTEDLFEEVVPSLREVHVRAPRIVNERASVSMDYEGGVSTQLISQGGERLEGEYALTVVPDVLGAIQNRTKLTKSTLLGILQRAGKLSDILVNPQQLIDESSRVINDAMKRVMIDGIKYEKIAGSFYEMTRFENDELESYLDKLVIVQNQEKTLYDHVLVDSQVESQFARDLEVREDVKFYFKLPSWFKIDTPLGGYNPDWAVVFEGDQKVYFVVETKGTNNLEELSSPERMKILCGRKHFAEFDEVAFVAPINRVVNINADV